MADEGFVIGLDFDTSDAIATAKELDKEVEKIFEQDRGTTDTAILNLDNQMRASIVSVDELSRKLQNLANEKIPTEEYKQITNEIDKTQEKLDSLTAKMDRMRQAGKDHGVTWDAMVAKADEMGERLSELDVKLKELVYDGKDFTLGKDTEEFARTKQHLIDAESRLNVQLIKHRQITGESKKTDDHLKNIAKNIGVATAATVKLQNGLKNVNKISKNVFRNILRWGLGISSAFVLINKMRNVLKEGMSQVYESKQFTKLNDQIDELKAKLATLKNAFVGAFLPLIETVIPYIQKFVEWLTKAVNLVAQFIAALMGRTTYYKALKKETDELKKQNKEREKSLSKLDKLNVLTSKQTEDESGGKPLFEEVPIDSKILDLIKKLKDWIDKLKSAIQSLLAYLSKLKDAFLKGFFDALGNWKQKLANIIQNLKDIWALLKEIFTDPEVLEAMDKWAQSFAYMLGALVGLIANIGLTLAEMLTGGFKKFLESKKEDIKQWLVDIFNVGTEINEIWGDTFVSLSRIIDTFAKENGQRLVAGIMSVAYEIWSNLLLLASKLFRDISNIITLWIRENEEKISQMIDNILGFGANVLDSIQQFLDEIFEYAQQVYDEHFKPLFDSIAEGVSELVGQFLDAWNENIKPLLDEVKVEIDNLLNTSVGPALKSLLDSLGALADFIKVLWETILKPVVSWCIQMIPALVEKVKAGLAFIKGALELIGNTAKTWFDALTHLFKMFIALINGDWKTAWSEAKNIFVVFKDGVLNNFRILWNTARSILGHLVSYVKTAWNTIKSIFDKITSGASRAQSAVNGVSAFSGDSRFKAPGAATGAVIPPQMSNRVFTVGDNNSETEVISPLSTMKQAMVEALQQMGTNNTGGGDIVINIDGREVFRVVQRQAIQYSNQHGGKPAFQGA